MSGRYVRDLREVDGEQVAVVGGKGARLGALTRIEGVRVPAGFCVTTDAFGRITEQVASFEGMLTALSRCDARDTDGIRTLGARIREALEGVSVPADVAAEITAALEGLGAQGAYAVRSSATAEDAPTASFAGQHDTYLGVVGAAEVMRHVVRCGASLFTERAVAYRLRGGVGHRGLTMAVVVQRMVPARASGVLFTADPVTGDRRVATVDAGFGLGEAVVSGLLAPDVFTVRDGVILARSVAVKKVAVRALPAGGTREVPLPPRWWRRPALTDGQVLRLVKLGRRVEQHFGGPQDIEWCLGEDGFHIVQSRPVTTLFPVPRRRDTDRHVYLSVGHQQMMTDAMRPLGLSMWQLTAMVEMHEAGGRLFVDVAPRLASPAGVAAVLEAMERADPLSADALRSVLARVDAYPAPTDPDPGADLGTGSGSGPEGAAPASGAATGPAPDVPVPDRADPADVATLIGRGEASLARLREDIRNHSGPGLFAFLLEAFEEHKQLLSDPMNHRAIMAGMEATWWLNDTLRQWLGEKNAADTLTLSAPGNITSQMGLALLDVADVIRPHPQVVAFLEGVGEEDFLDGLTTVPGGGPVRRAIEAYLDRYGMRCAGEIDITRPRWSEEPWTLVPLILDNVRSCTPGAAQRRFAAGRQRAREKENDLLTRVRALPDGERRARDTRRMIDQVHAFVGYREYPKYQIVSRYSVYKQALWAEAERLVREGVLSRVEDIHFLTFQEFHDVARTRRVDGGLVRRRRDAFEAYRTLRVPRVLTSDGEAIVGEYRRDDVPAGALAGLPVCAGTVEGRARVVLDLADAVFEPGDILVTAHTDPGWTPAFLTVAALVTEVGGLMTHGAVIAREYGLPAVVGVEGATRLIRDGQRIRVHGSDGYVALLS